MKGPITDFWLWYNLSLAIVWVPVLGIFLVDALRGLYHRYRDTDAALALRIARAYHAAFWLTLFFGVAFPALMFWLVDGNGFLAGLYFLFFGWRFYLYFFAWR